MNVLQQLQAGIRVEFNESGRFLRILASEQQDKITVQFYRNGALISEALQVGRGFSETMEDGNFDSYAVTSSVTQNVNIVTRAGSRILYDTPPVGDVNILSLPPVTIANPDAQKRYDDFAASFKSNAALATNTAETVFTGAANINGAIIWSASFTGITATSSGNKLSALLAKSSNPSSITDGDVILGTDLSLSSGATAYFITNGKLERPVLIQAGKGLHFITSFNDVAGCSSRHVNYTFL